MILGCLHGGLFGLTYFEFALLVYCLLWVWC